MKVLHLPTSVGGNSWGLSQAEIKLGIESEVLITEENWLGYESDISLHIERKFFISKFTILIKTFLEVKNNYDIFHFNYGSSLLDFQNIGLFLLDLPFYDKSKKIVFTYNGSDCRGVHPLDYWDNLENSKTTLYQKLVFFLKKQRIKKVNKYADHIFALNPDLLRYLPNRATFLPYTISSFYNINRVPHIAYKDKVNIVHSPTNRSLKGTKYILGALSKLKSKYSNIEINLVENVSHNKALMLYRDADIIIDQVLIGWYGAFAVEAMLMGKPVAVHIRKDDLKCIPSGMRKDLMNAIIDISPLNIVEKLSEYIENPKLLEIKSNACYEYSRRWHDPSKIAGYLQNIYDGSSMPDNYCK